MTFAAINWLNISINLLLVVFFIVCLLMVLLILMQRPKQEGLGATFGTNVTDQVFGARTTNVLQKGTVYLGTAFFVLSLLLAVLIGKRNTSNSLIVRENKAAAEAPAQPEPQKSLAEQAQEAGQTVPVEVKPALETPAVPATEPAPTEATPAAPTAPTEAPKTEAPQAPVAPEPPAQAPVAPAETPVAPAGEEKPAAP